MQCIFTYGAGVYWWLSEVSSEIHIFNFEPLSPGHYIFMLARM